MTALEHLEQRGLVWRKGKQEFQEEEGVNVVAEEEEKQRQMEEEREYFGMRKGIDIIEDDVSIRNAF